MRLTDVNPDRGGRYPMWEGTEGRFLGTRVRDPPQIRWNDARMGYNHKSKSTTITSYYGQSNLPK